VLSTVKFELHDNTGKTTKVASVLLTFVGMNSDLRTWIEKVMHGKKTNWF